MNKRTAALTALLGTLIFASASATASAASGPRLVVSGQEVTYSYARGPHYHESRLYIAADALAASLGVTLTYDEATKTLSLNGKAVTWDYSAFRGPHIHEERLFVPVRPIAEAIGAAIGWDPVSQTATITRPAAAGIKVQLNGVAVTYDYARAPHIHENEIYMPAKALAEALGTAWSHDAQTKVLTVGGKQVAWDYTLFRGPHEHENHLFVAVRPVAEALGLHFQYDAASGTVTLTRH